MSKINGSHSEAQIMNTLLRLRYYGLLLQLLLRAQILRLVLHLCLLEGQRAGPG